MLWKKNLLSISSWLVILGIPILCFAYYIYDSNLFYYLKNFTPDIYRYTIYDMMYSSFHFDLYMIWSTIYMQILFPLFATAPVILFFREKNGSLAFQANRVKHYKQHIIHKILKYAFFSASLCFVGYLITYLIGVALFPTNLEFDAFRNMFADILGAEFYLQHRYSYYLLEGFLKYFLTGFVYSFFGLSIALFTDKKFLFILIPTIYFLGTSAIIGLLTDNVFILYFIPSFVFFAASNDNLSTASLFIGFIPPLLISFSLIYKKLRNKYEKIID